MRIGELADATGTTPRTIRFYEERRLMPPPERSASGQRVYRDEHVGRLALVRELLALGLTIEDVALLADDLHLLDVETLPQDTVPPAARTARAEALFARRLALLNSQIALLTALRDKVASCHAALVAGPPTESAARPASGDDVRPEPM